MAIDLTRLETWRRPRIFGMAIFDWVTSLFAAFLIGWFALKLRTVLGWVLWILVWVFFGIAVHWMLGIQTMLGYYLGLNPKPIRTECTNGTCPFHPSSIK